MKKITVGSSLVFLAFIFTFVSLSLVSLLPSKAFAVPATPTFIKLKEANPKSGNTNIVSTGNFSGSVATGNLIVVWLWYNTSSQSVSSVADTKGNAYFKAVGPTTGTGAIAGWRQEVWYAKNVTGGSSFGVTATFTGTFNAEKSITAHEYSGIDPVSPLDVVASAVTSTSNSTSGAVTTNYPNDLIFGAGFFQGSGTQGSGFTRRSSVASNVSEDKVAANPGSNAATFVNSAQMVISQMVAFKAANLPDTTAPSVPTNLSATPVSTSQINLSWTASTDNVAVVGYKVFRAGVQIATTTVTNYSNTGLNPSTLYSYTVSAYDAAGNVSAQSTSASATTLATPDTTSPSTPTNLSATTVSSSQINLSWTASTDNVAVAGYKVFRSGVQIATTTVANYSNTGLNPSTLYSYTVSAYDAANNNSLQSTSASATTQALPVPVINTFTSSPSAIISGQTSTLSWSVTNATSLSINQGVGVVTGTSKVVSPSVTTSYTLTATNSYGSVMATTTVTVSPDTVAPTAPSNLQVSNITSNSTTLSWATSTDNVLVSGYKIFRNNVQVATTSLTSYVNSGLAASTTYSYFVSAYDVANNVSLQSNSLDATTLSVPNGPVYPVKVSASGRYLTDQNNVPFFWDGESAWSLISQATNEIVNQYLDDRQQKGVNVVMVQLIDDYYANNHPYNIYGDAPFTGANFTTPNESYFAHADSVINAAAARGMTVLLTPMYLGWQCGDQGWCAEIQAASIADMQSYATYLGNRYQNYDNIIWLMGGDADPYPVADKLTAFVTSLLQVDSRHLVAVHNGRGKMGVETWPGANWISLNTTYSNYLETYTQAQSAYNISPAKPFIQVEAWYENEHGMNPQGLRAQNYWTVLSGGSGHTFGNCPLWGFGTTNTTVFCGLTGWEPQLNTLGSIGMMYAKNLFNDKAWYNLVPDWSHATLTSGYGTFGQDDYVTAGITPDGTLGLAYLPSVRTVTVNMSKFNSAVNARWYDPTNGTYSTISGSPFANTSTRQFTPANINAGGDGDWVLVLEGTLPPDIAAPSAPTDLSATPVSASQINLSWTASTDNYAVTGYKVFRGGVQIATTTSINYSNSGLTASTTYSYTASAYDAAGNISAQSTSVATTTQSSGPLTQPTFVTEAHSSTDGGGLAYNNASLPITVSGPNPMLIAAWHSEWDGVGTTLGSVSPESWSVKNNGVPGTLLTEANGYTGNDGNRRFRIYYWLNPPQGSNTVTVENPNSGPNELSVSAILLNNVDQTNPFGTPTLDVSLAGRTGESETVTTTTSDLALHVIADALLTTGVLGNGETARSRANDGIYKGPADGDASIWISTKPGINGNTTVSSSGWASGPAPSPRIINGVGVAIHGAGAVAPDTIAPSTPSGLQSSSVTSSSATISWIASTDNIGVTGYQIFRNGNLINSTSQTSYADNLLTASTTYSYTVVAYDAANNFSAPSQPLIVTTSPVSTSPTFVQSCSNDAAGNPVVTCTLSSNVVVGDVIAVFTGHYNTSESVTVTDNLGNNYTNIQSTGYASADAGMAYAVVTTGGPATITATWTGGSAIMTIHAHEISGVNTTTPLDNNQKSMAGGEAASISSGNINTIQNGDYIFAGAYTTGALPGTGSGFTSRGTANYTNSNIFTSRSEDRIQTSAGTIAGTFTLGGGQYWNAGVMAFKPAGQ